MACDAKARRTVAIVIWWSRAMIIPFIVGYVRRCYFFFPALHSKPKMYTFFFRFIPFNVPTESECWVRSYIQLNWEFQSWNRKKKNKKITKQKKQRRWKITFFLSNLYYKFFFVLWALFFVCVCWPHVCFGNVTSFLRMVGWM